MYLFVGRHTDMTVNEEEDTSKKLIKKFWFRERVSKRCMSDNVMTRETYGRDRHHENDFWTQSWHPNDELQQNYVSYRESVVDDSWRSAVFEMSQNDTISTMDCSDCLRKCVLSIISSVMYVDTILNWMNIQTRIRRWWITRKYSNVIKKVCIELKTRPDFDLQDDDWYDMKDIILQRADWMSTSKRLRKIEIAFIDVMEQLEIMDVGLVGTERKNIIMTFIGGNLTKWTRWYHFWNTVM